MKEGTFDQQYEKQNNKQWEVGIKTGKLVLKKLV